MNPITKLVAALVKNGVLAGWREAWSEIATDTRAAAEALEGPEPAGFLTILDVEPEPQPAARRPNGRARAGR